jgi:hypothetical protein
VPPGPDVERQISNPASFVALSLQASAIALGDEGVAERPVGAAGGGMVGTGVVAQSVFEKADGWPLLPTARTR